MSDAKGSVDNLAICAELFAYQRAEDIDYKSIAAKLGIPVQRVTGLIVSAKSKPEVWYSVAERYGYKPEQRPPWAGKGVIEKAPPKARVSEGGDTTPPPPTSPGTLSKDQPPKETQRTPESTQPPISIHAPNAPPGSPRAAGPQIEALGSDAVKRWMDENNIVEMNGAHYQQRQLPTGETALVPTKIPREILLEEAGGNERISDMVFRGLEGETINLMRKVAFNPEAYTYYSWCVRKGYIAPDKDFADFVNQCIQLTMTKIFGARVGVIIDEDSSLIGQLKRGAEARPHLKVEYH